MVKITIPSGKTFHLHIDILCDKCKYFRAALTGNFEEADTKQLVLEEVSDNTFGFFLKWLYGGSIQADSDLTWTGFFDLWFFADYLCIPALQNHVVDALFAKNVAAFAKPHLLATVEFAPDDRTEQIPPAVKMLWARKARTERGDIAKPLCELLLDFVANPQYMAKNSAREMLKTLPDAFVREYALRAVERSSFVDDQTDFMITLVRETEDSDIEYHEDLVDDGILQHTLGKLEENITTLHDMWRMTAEKYHVKNPKDKKMK